MLFGCEGEQGSEGRKFAILVLIFVTNTLSFSNRRQQEAELKLIAEETAKRVEEAIRKKVAESLESEEIKREIQKLLEEGRKKLHEEVTVELEKGKQAALLEAQRKEASSWSKLIFSVLYTTVCPQFMSWCVDTTSMFDLGQSLVPALMFLPAIVPGLWLSPCWL